MRKPEQEFWRNHLRGFLSSNPDVEYDRIESSTSPGVPDLHLSMPQNRHWIELKVGLEKNKIVDISHYTAIQKNWAKRHGQKSGNVWFLLVVPNWPAENQYFCHLVPWENSILFQNKVSTKYLMRNSYTGCLNEKGQKFKWDNFFEYIA